MAAPAQSFRLGSGQTDNEFDLDRPLKGDIAQLCTAKFVDKIVYTRDGPP
jgi:hypothetical protein